MSVVIVGGNERMACQYKSICEKFRCKVKIFNQLPGDFKARIGSPDLVVLFTNTVSHKMMLHATQEAARTNTTIARSHSSSSTALKGILEQHFCAVAK